jgi:hypothetical protein
MMAERLLKEMVFEPRNDGGTTSSSFNGNMDVSSMNILTGKQTWHQQAAGLLKMGENQIFNMQEC